MLLSKWVEEWNDNISQLSREAGVSRQTIYNLLNGKQVPTVGTARRISDATGGVVSVAAIMKAACLSQDMQYWGEKRERT